MQDFSLVNLVTCIRDGRLPLAEEVASVSAKLWQEGLAHHSPERPELARILAQVALSGDPEMIDANEILITLTRAEVFHFDRHQIVNG